MDTNGWLQEEEKEVIVESDQSRAQRHVMRGSTSTFGDGWTPEEEEGREEGRERAGYRGFNLKSVNNLMVLIQAEKQNISKWLSTASLHSSVSGESISKPVSAEVFVSKLRVRRRELEMIFNGNYLLKGAWKNTATANLRRSTLHSTTTSLAGQTFPHMTLWNSHTVIWVHFHKGSFILMLPEQNFKKAICLN